MSRSRKAARSDLTLIIITLFLANMVASDFIDLFSKVSVANRITIEDFSDRLNLFTVVLILVACIIVTAKQYLLNSISCYIPVQPSGNNYAGYLADYCWVHGTIPLRADERMPSSNEEWDLYDKYRRINYYQWVPFVLGLQCIIFYLPHVLWQIMSSHRAGGDLVALLQNAHAAATKEREERRRDVKRFAEFLQDMITGQQDIRRSRRSSLIRRAYHMFGLLIASKRMGTRIAFSYLVVKIFTILNAFCQIILIQYFLGFHESGTAGHISLYLGQDETKSIAETGPLPEYQTTHGIGFGISVLSLLIRGYDWPKTTIFPRVAYCRVPGLRLVGTENTYTAQCALPVNMLNEKIYIFLWFWIVILLGLDLVSLALWLHRLIAAPHRKGFIKRFLRTKGIKNLDGRDIMQDDLDEFVDEYLRRDGIFLIRMLELNAGDVITAEIVVELYNYYIKHVLNEEAIREKIESFIPHLEDGDGEKPVGTNNMVFV